MRKLLLATAATFGATLAMTGGAMAQPVKPVAPGTVVVHVNGYLQFGFDDENSTYNKYISGGSTSKLSPVTTNGEVRIYPGFDAKTVGGVEYGAQIELRTAFTNAGEGVNSNATAGNGNGTGNLYVRRAYGYVGEKTLGYVRFGQSDGAFGLLQDGVIEAFGDGSQFGSTDTSLQVVPSKAQPGQFIYADQGALYTADKLVLLSPAITEPLLGGAFTAVASYEPNSNGIKEGNNSNCTVAGGTCDNTTSTGTFSSTLAKQRQNTFDGAVQYALKANGFNTKVSVGILDGSPIHYTGATNPAYNLDTLQVFQAGAQTTYANLFTTGDAILVGGNIKVGQTLDGYAPKPKGTRDAVAYIVGASYTVGPYVLGASFFDSQTAGSKTPAAAKASEARTLSEYGVSVGGNYVIGKDLSLYAQYMYGHSHQPGNGFAGAGTAGTPAPTPAKSNTQMQLVSVGATFKW